MITPCDEYGSTDTELRLYAERDAATARAEKAERERDDLRAAMTELAPAEVCVRGDWFKVSELPEVLGRVMDARDEAQREAKRYYLRAMTPALAPKSPTAKSFAKAQFAWHPDGRIAARVDDDSPQWRSSSRTVLCRWLSDADMAAEGWSIVTPAPSTPREALALVVDLAYEPEGDTMPDQDGNMVVVDSGEINVYSDGNSYGLPARGPAYRRLLLDPPAPVTPAWHDAPVIRGRVTRGVHTDDERFFVRDAGGPGLFICQSGCAHKPEDLSDVTVVVPGEVEA